jgi:hexokinase
MRMQASELARLMDMELLQPEMESRALRVQGCYIGDLLSNVMGNARTGQLWVTVMNNINVVAVAQLLELAGIVLVEGNRADEAVLARATLEEIPVFSLKDTAYEAAVRFHEAGLDGQ